jgi:hypothetical protein
MKICTNCGRQNPDDCTWCPECGTIPRSERIKRALITPFAISPIMKRCAVPSLIGIVVLAIGFIQKIRWLEIVGVILAAPILWVYFVIIFVFMPMLIFGKIRRGRKDTR